MTDQPSAPARAPMSARAKRAAMAVLFSVILLIPRIRRLRRKVWAWTLVRCLAGLAGAELIWRFAAGRLGAGPAQAQGTAPLLFGVGLLVLGALVKARPETPSLDQLARELEALVVVNGGRFLPPNGAQPAPDVNLLVGAERLLVLNRRRQPVAEIPLGQVQHLSAHVASLPEPSARPGSYGRGAAGPAWDLEVVWESSPPQTACFRYQGVFAEHLARVAEQTIRSLWKKGLPVLP